MLHFNIVDMYIFFHKFEEMFEEVVEITILRIDIGFVLILVGALVVNMPFGNVEYKCLRVHIFG